MPALAWRTDGPVGAPTLVLLNSVGTTTEMWEPCLAPLTEHFRVVRIDTRGHGDSPASPPGTHCRIDDIGRDVLAVLDRLGPGRVHVAGVSLGAMTAMWLAIHHPERVGRLGLVCTSAYLPPAEFWLGRAAAVRAGGMAAIADSAPARWITPEGAERDVDLMARLRAMFVSIDAESYAQCCEAIAAMDLRADLGRIAAPTLVVAGPQDVATPPEHAEVIADGVAGARLEVLDTAAHLATYEQPRAIADLLLGHLRAGATLAGGFATRRAVLGDAHVDRAIEATTGFNAPFQEFLTRYAWGDVWSRPELSRRERSIATLAALVSLGAEHELGIHVLGARRNGLTTDEIREVLMHTALYAGLPRANRAFAVAHNALASDAVEAADTPADTPRPATGTERQTGQEQTSTEG